MSDRRSAGGARRRTRALLLPAAVLLAAGAGVALWPYQPVRPATCIPCREQADLLPPLESLSAGAAAVFRAIQGFESAAIWNDDAVEAVEILCLNAEAAAGRWPGLTSDELTHAACWAMHAAGGYLFRAQEAAPHTRHRLSACIELSFTDETAARRGAAIRAAAIVRANASEEFTEQLTVLQNDHDPRVARLASSVLGRSQYAKRGTP